MPNVSNVNIPSISKKKLHTRLTFNVGEKISAKIISVDELKKTAILKLADGWQFSAEIEELLDYIPNESFGKFKVIGNKNGKLLLKLIKEDIVENETDSSSLEKFIKEKLNVKDKTNFEMLHKMLKYNIPLTRENVARVKNIVDFQSKLLLNNEEQDTFIEKYLISKNIATNSEKGIDISNTLKRFFSELKNIDLETLLTFMENDIELTEENIKSFNEVFKKTSTIYNNLKETVNTKNSTTNNENENIMEEKSNNFKATVNNEEEHIKNQLNAKGIERIDNKNVSNVIKELNNDKIIDKIKIKESDVLKLKTDNLVKNEIANKIDEIKDIVKLLVDDKFEIKPQLYNNIKIFNSVSNQYYYLDMPLNIYQKQYPCKIIIKDDRKKGKKIDSKNVKIVTSVKTLNMGTVDAYISVYENSMNVNIKCDEKWMQMVDGFKEKLLTELSNSNYKVSVKVDKREREVNLINCREFFEDKNIGRIDTRV